MTNHYCQNCKMFSRFYLISQAKRHWQQVCVSGRTPWWRDWRRRMQWWMVWSGVQKRIRIPFYYEMCTRQKMTTALMVLNVSHTEIDSLNFKFVKPVGESNTMLFWSLFQGDPTKSKVTWSPYAQINEEKNIWCQWPGFG